MENFRAPLSRCPACLRTCYGRGPCECGYGTKVPRYKGDLRSEFVRLPSNPIRALGGIHVDIGRALDAAIGNDSTTEW